MNKRIYLFFLFTIALALYLFERDTMFSEEIAEGGKVSIAILVGSLLLISLMAVLLSNKTLLRDRLSKRFSRLWLFICFLSFIYSLWYPLGTRNIYGMIIMPLLLFYFSCTTTQYAKSENVIIWTMTFVFFLLAYYYLNNHYNNELLDAEHTSSGSYIVLYLLPFLLCHKKQVLRLLAILLTLVVIMFSLKRGGFLALLAAVIVYLLIFQIGINKKQFNLWRAFLLIVLPIGFYMLIIYLNDNVLNGLLFSRFQEDETGGSGRLVIFQQYWMMILDSSPWYLLVGHGWQGSLRDSGIGLTCHNDFLESFIDFGVFGFILYILLYIELIKFCKRMVQDNNKYAPAMGASIAMFFVNSMVSHILIYPTYLVLFSLFWGFMVSTSSNLITSKKVYNESRSSNLSRSL